MAKAELAAVGTFGDKSVEVRPDFLLCQDRPRSQLGPLLDGGGIDTGLPSALPVVRHVLGGTRESSPQLRKLPLLDLLDAQRIRPHQLCEVGAEGLAVADTGLAEPVQGGGGVLKGHGQPVVDPLAAAPHGMRSTCPAHPKCGEKCSVSVSRGASRSIRFVR